MRKFRKIIIIILKKILPLKIFELLQLINKKISDRVDYDIIVRLENDPFIMDKRKFNIAIVRFGGVGDTLMISILASAIKDKYPSAIISAVVGDSSNPDILHSNKNINMVFPVQPSWNSIIIAKIEPFFDIIYDWRFIVKVLYRDPEKFSADKSFTDAVFSKYDCGVFDIYPLHADKYTKFNINQMDLALKSANLNGDINDVDIFIEDWNMFFYNLFKNKKYVTIHHGSDYRTSMNGYQVKNWFTDGWEKVVLFLNSKGYTVIQIGTNVEKPIKGAIDLLGRTWIKDACSLIKGAQFHLDTEGGFVHIAHFLKKKSIVLFGPTPIKFFGYKENINIKGPGCDIFCFQKKKDWYINCVKGYRLPKCMDSITPEMVIVEINTLIDDLNNKSNLV